MTFVDLFSGKEKLQPSGGCWNSLLNRIDIFLEQCLKIKGKKSYIKKASTQHLILVLATTKNFLTCCPNQSPSLSSRTYR